MIQWYGVEIGGWRSVLSRVRTQKLNSSGRERRKCKSILREWRRFLAATDLELFPTFSVKKSI